MSNFSSLTPIPEPSWVWAARIRWGCLVLLAAMMIYLLYAAVTLTSDMVLVTDVACYQGDMLIYEGVARGSVRVPENQAPWVFTDHTTGNEIVIGAYCHRRESQFIPMSEKED